MSAPEVSVVLPVYDGARHLAESIESVLAQTYASVELIVVDDGSTDESARIADGYAASGVRVLRQENAGTAAARNAGILAARGGLVAHLDADDVWLPDGLRRRVEALLADESADVASGRIEPFFSPELRERDRAGLRPPPPLVAHVAPAMLLRRRAYDRVGLYDASLRAGQDLEWLLRAREAGLRFVEIPDLVARRRLHDANKGRAHPELARLRCRILKESLDRRRARRAEAEEG